MEDQLRKIVEKTCGERQMESTSDLEKIEQIANCHLESMRWLMDQIEAELKQIQHRLPKDDEENLGIDKGMAVADSLVRTVDC
jgi:Tfp pilus assembly protein PilO